MTTRVMFDTLGFMDELKESGLDIKTAEAITKATSKACSQMIETQELVTKGDIKELKIELMKFISDNNWKMIGVFLTINTILLTIFHFIGK